MIERIDLIPLLDIQDVDERIRRVEGLLAALPEEAELTAALTEQAEVTPVYDERTAERTRLDREQQRLEDEVETVRARLAKEQQRFESGTVTSPREIMALQNEIDALARRISTLEDDELEIMETAEAVDVTLAELKVGIDAVGARVAAAMKARDESAAALAIELETLRTRRVAMVVGVEPGVLDRYEKLRKAQSGAVVAAFDGKTCGGCGLPLSPASREEFKASSDAWFPCENCRRVLVPR